MRYLEVLSPSTYGTLGIQHSAIQDGDTILSFENGVFKIYNKSYLDTRYIIVSEDIPRFDIKSCEGLELTGFTCFEALQYVANKSGVQLPIQKKNDILRTWIMLGTIGILFIIIALMLSYMIGSHNCSLKEFVYFITS